MSQFALLDASDAKSKANMCDWQKHASFLSHFLSITWSTWFLKTNNRPSQKNEGRNLIFLCGAPS